MSYLVISSNFSTVWQGHHSSLSAKGRYKILRGTISAWWINTLEMGKICDFRPKLPFISETARDRPCLLLYYCMLYILWVLFALFFLFFLPFTVNKVMYRGIKLQVADRSVSISVNGQMPSGQMPHLLKNRVKSPWIKRPPPVKRPLRSNDPFRKWQREHVQRVLRYW